MASTERMPNTERMKVTDVTVLAALAHPVRTSILHLLLTVGEQTATQCSDVVDATPSACSYHLRHLERFGLVERVDQDGRARRRRADEGVACRRGGVRFR